MGLFVFILILIVLILVHEFGHFIVAKLFGIRVDEFSVGFPPRLFSRYFGETRYSFGALLLGGYVSIFGERAGEGKGDPRSLTHKPRLVQVAVVVAGVASNILLAWLVFSLGYMVGLPTAQEHEGFGEVRDPKPLIVGVFPDSPASRAGIEPEDVVVKVETGLGASTEGDVDAAQVRAFIAQHQEESLLLRVIRDGEEKVFLARAEEGLAPGRKVLGIEVEDYGILTLPWYTALLQGAMLTERTTLAVAGGLASFFITIVRGVADFSTVAGPIGIISFGASAVGQGIAETLVLSGLISINLALINLLPIPGLDGGRLLIIGIEGLLRRPVSEKLTTALTFAGLALLIFLMVAVSFHDIVRLVS